MAHYNTKNVYEVIAHAASGKLRADKIKRLREGNSQALQDVLRGTYDDTIQWDLPTGEVPYINTFPDGTEPKKLFSEHMKFKFFVKGFKAGANLKKRDKESMFLSILETIHPEDSKLMIKMINKDRIKNITKAHVCEAFPNLIDLNKQVNK